MHWFLAQRLANRGRSPQSSTSAGFTITELLATILLAIALASLVGPGWIGFMNNRRANAVRDEIVQGLRDAQERAIRNRIGASVTIDTSVDPPLVRVAGVDSSRQGTAGLQPGMVSLRTNPPGVSQVSFAPDGSLDVSDPLPINFIVSAGEARRCVVIDSLLGAINVLSRGEGTGARECE
ncbi:MAG: hypothetical protein KME20_03510 [Kaiparowitsia implicata GSE-PSE-MK54-09C]|nr:hypothetical protein [Kaiparowitsia implicata GSE-PSE-MK54-09C]